MRLQSAPGRGVQGQEKGILAGPPGLSKTLGTQRHRCGHHRHGRVSAGAALHPRLSGRKGHLRRKTIDALHPGRPRAGECGAAMRPRLAGRLATTVDGHEPDRLRVGAHRRLGKVLEVQAVNYTGCCDSPAQPFPEQPVPAGLDWDMWLNQSSWRPFNQRVDALAEEGSMPRFRRRRDHQLGRARRRSDSMGAGHGRDRPGGSAAA